MSEEEITNSFVPDITLSKALFASNSTNNFSASNTGSRGINGVTNMRYGTVQEDTTGNGKVKVILDGSTEVIEVDCSETFKAGDRVCVLYFNGSYKAFSLMGGTIGGNMVVFDGIFANKIIANEAFIQKLTAAEAFIENLTANKAFISELIANNAFIDQLISNYAFIENLEAKYVMVDKANIDQAWINDLFIQSQFVAQEGTVFQLTGLHIDANDITTGTLTVDRLVVQGSDGEYYLLEPDGTGKFDQTKLNGNIIKQNSLHADRITANTITVDKITTNNLVGTGGWINLANGTFAYGNTQKSNGKYLGNFITWDGKKLKLNVDELNIDSTSFSDELEVLRTSIKQTSDRVEVVASTASSAQSTANTANSNANSAKSTANSAKTAADAAQASVDDLLTTKFIFDSSGLKIQSSKSSYYMKLHSSGFDVLRTSDDKGFRMYMSGSGNSSKAYFTTNSMSISSMHFQIDSGYCAFVINPSYITLSRSTSGYFLDQLDGYTNGRFYAWHPIYSNSSGATGSITFTKSISLSISRILIIYYCGDLGTNGHASVIYDGQNGNGYVLLTSNYNYNFQGICMEARKMQVTNTGLTVADGGRCYMAYGQNQLTNCVQNTALTSIRAVYLLS